MITANDKKEIIEAIQSGKASITERGNGWTEDDYWLIKIVKTKQREKFCMTGPC